MTRFEKKRQLNRYNQALIELDKLGDAYADAFNQATKLTPALSDLPKGQGVDSKQERYALKLVDIEDKIRELTKNKLKIDSELAALKPRDEMLVKLIDIDGIDIHRVAKMIKYDYKGLIKKHNKILDKIDL